MGFDAAARDRGLVRPNQIREGNPAEEEKAVKSSLVYRGMVDEFERKG